MKKATALFILALTSFFQINAKAKERGKDIPLSHEDKRAVIYLLKSAKELSAKDKEVIIEIFKTIDVSLYRFEFSKNEIYGAKTLPKAMWYSLRAGNKGTLSGSIVQNYYPAVNFWFVINNPKPPGEGLEGVFGKANAARLQAVINKYTGGQ